MPDKDQNPIDVAAITKSVTEAVTEKVTTALTKTLTDQFSGKLGELEKNVSVLADTLKALPPAEPVKKEVDAKKDDAPKAVTSEDVDKRVADGVAAALKARDDEAAKKTARQGLVDKIVKEKLGGDVKLAANLVGDDEAALTASADSLAANIKTYKPDFGGVQKDGGTPPGGTPPKMPIGNLSEGTAKFAASIKLPA